MLRKTHRHIYAYGSSRLPTRTCPATIISAALAPFYRRAPFYIYVPLRSLLLLLQSQPMPTCRVPVVFAPTLISVRSAFSFSQCRYTRREFYIIHIVRARGPGGAKSSYLGVLRRDKRVSRVLKFLRLCVYDERAHNSWFFISSNPGFSIAYTYTRIIAMVSAEEKNA